MTVSEIPPFSQEPEAPEQEAASLAASSVATEIAGGNPLSEPPLSPLAIRSSAAAWIGEQVALGQMQAARKAEVDAEFEGPAKAYRDSIIERFKAHNDGLVSEDLEVRAWQSRPITLDPNEQAGISQLMTQWHQARIAAGVDEGLFNDPSMANLTKVLTADMGLGQPGYFVGGEQPYAPDYGPLGWLATEVVNPAVSGVWNAGFGLGYNIAALAYEAITGEPAMDTLPTVGLRDEGGNMHTNAGKLPSFNQSIVAVWETIFGGEVEQAVQNVGLAEEFAALRRSGITEVVNSTASTLGMFAGMTVGAGPAMAAGHALARVGLVKLIGANRIAASSPWVKKFLGLSAQGGAVMGNGLAIGMMHGHHAGFETAFTEGAAVTIPILGFGALGKKFEASLRMLTRSKMPAFAERALSGALQGAGFTGWEMATSPELWERIRNPNAETEANWGRILRDNVLGMGIFHSVMGTTPGQYALDRQRGFGPEVTEARVAERAFEERALADVVRERREAEPKPLPPTELEGAEAVAGALEGKRVVPPEPTSPLERVARAEGEKISAGLEAKQQAEQETREGPLRRELEEPPPDKVPLREGRELSFEESGMGRQEWKVRDAEGRLIAGGSLSVEGKKAQIWSAEVREEFRGQGIYPEVIKELQRRFPEGVESIEQTPEAQRAWKKAGGEVSRGTFQALGEGLLAEQRGERGAAEPARRAAQIEASGATEEMRSQAAEERLSEEVSRRGEFPAEGRGIPVEGVPGTESIHARDVIAEAQVGPIAPAVQAGNMGAMKRWAMGYYSTREDLIRMEGARDLSNLGHEWGHALWSKLGARMGLRPRALEQLLEVGKPTSTERMRRDQKLHEGMAEFIARDLLGDTGLASKYPELWAEANNFLGKPEQSAVLEQLNRMRESFRRWREQGEDAQVRMSWIAGDEALTTQEAQLILGRPVQRITPWVRARVGWRKALVSFEHAMVDDLARISRAQKQIFKAAGIDPMTLPIEANPVRMMNALRGKSGAVMETFLFRHAIGFAGVGGRKGPSLREGLAEIKVGERDSFTSYLTARRSLEALAKNMPAQLPRQHYEGYVARHGNPRFERAAQQLKEWFDHLIDYSVQAGALTTKAGDAIKDAWVVYVPFFRALQGPSQVAPGRGVAERGSGVQRMRGSEVEIRDPLEAALEVGQSIIQKAHQAAAMKAFYTLHLTTKGVGGFVTEVPRDIKPQEVTFEALADALERLNFPGDIQQISETFAGALRDLSVDDAKAVITMFTQESRPSGSKPIVAFVPRYTEAELARYETRVADQMREANGKLKWMRLDNDAYEAVMNSDPSFQAQHPIARALAMPAYVVKFGATVVNPAFMIRNIARDTILNSLFTDVKNNRRFIPVFGAITNFVEGLSAQIKHDPGAETFVDIGGMQATFLGREFAMPSKHVLNPRTAAEGYRKVISALATPEGTHRVREFIGIRDRALREGKSELEANLEALEAGQEISVNFIRAGVVGRAFNHYIPYFNAGIQGNRKFLRHVLGYEGRAKQMQAIAQGIANITLPSFALWMLYKDEDWYRDLPSWRRNNYWTIPIPFTDELFSVPKPFEAGKIFGNIPEYLMNLHQGQPVPLTEVGYDMLSNFFNGFDWMPAFMGPSVESITNYSFWKGRRIVPDWMEEGRLPKDQYTSYTTGTAKLFGKWFGFSPSKVEHWLSQHTGGMALTAMRAVDTLTGGTPAAVDPGFTPEDIPFVGSFFRQQPHGQSQAVQDVYDLHRRLNQLAGSDELTGAQQRMRPVIRRATKRLSGVTKLVREGQISPGEGNRRKFEIAQPIMRAYEGMSK